MSMSCYISWQSSQQGNGKSLNVLIYYSAAGPKSSNFSGYLICCLFSLKQAHPSHKQDNFSFIFWLHSKENNSLFGWSERNNTTTFWLNFCAFTLSCFHELAHVSQIKLRFISSCFHAQAGTWVRWNCVSYHLAFTHRPARESDYFLRFISSCFHAQVGTRVGLLFALHIILFHA